MDECGSESDDDDEVVAFVDESDSETEVPVNTPGSTRTRAGRLSIPNSRYLDCSLSITDWSKPYRRALLKWSVILKF